MVTVPLRPLPVELGLISTETLPLPLALRFDVMLIQLALLVAVQLHPSGALMPMLPSPPPTEKNWLAGASELEHPAEELRATTVSPSTRANESRPPSGEYATLVT